MPREIVALVEFRQRMRYSYVFEYESDEAHIIWETYLKNLANDLKIGDNGLIYYEDEEEYVALLDKKVQKKYDFKQRWFK